MITLLLTPLQCPGGTIEAEMPATLGQLPELTRPQQGLEAGPLDVVQLQLGRMPQLAEVKPVGDEEVFELRERDTLVLLVVAVLIMSAVGPYDAVIPPSGIDRESVRLEDLLG